MIKNILRFNKLSKIIFFAIFTSLIFGIIGYPFYQFIFYNVFGLYSSFCIGSNCFGQVGEVLGWIIGPLITALFLSTVFYFFNLEEDLKIKKNKSKIFFLISVTSGYSFLIILFISMMIVFSSVPFGL
ncbi:hypothetical protein KKH36_02355 [Patescibacteria group bacterium]|nr:hypothetical protein [Patescibacteria group bacterium]